MFKKILVPLDGSELAEGILPYVMQMARGLDLPVTLLSVVDPEDVEMPDSASGPGADALVGHISSVGVDVVDIDFPSSGSSPRSARLDQSVINERGQMHATQIYEEAAVEMRSYLEEKAREIVDRGITVSTLVRFGDAAEQILDAADNDGCGLVAMSTHGRTAFGRGLIGSVADRVAHSSGLPTLIISPERAKAYWSGDSIFTSLMVPLDGSTLSEQALPVAERLGEGAGPGCSPCSRLQDGRSLSLRWHPWPGGSHREGGRYLPGEHRRRAGEQGAQRILGAAEGRSCVRAGRLCPEDAPGHDRYDHAWSYGLSAAPAGQRSRSPGAVLRRPGAADTCQGGGRLAAANPLPMGRVEWAGPRTRKRCGASQFNPRRRDRSHCRLRPRRCLRRCRPPTISAHHPLRAHHDFQLPAGRCTLLTPPWLLLCDLHVMSLIRYA